MIFLRSGASEAEIPSNSGARKPDGTADDHLVGELVVAAEQKAAVVIQATLLGKARTVRVEKPAAAAKPVPPPVAPMAGPTGTP